jgi:RND family efflux transporter MFP subunit
MERTTAGVPVVAAPTTPKEVAAVKAERQIWPITVRVQGSLMADEDAVIGSKLAGRVETIDVDLGSVVREGQSMVVLDRRELELRVQQANAQLTQACSALGLKPDDDELQLRYAEAPAVMLEQALLDEAQANVTRAEQLLPTKAMTMGEFDTLVAQLKTAEARHLAALNSVSEQVSLIGVRRAELALANQQLADAQITAPFDAIVEARHVSPGEYVQVGQSVVTLVRVDRLRFTAGVPESKAAPIQVGQKVEIRVAGTELPLHANVSRMSPTVLQTSRSVRIEADLENPELKLQAGLFAEAEIVVNADAQTLVVPATAVSQFAGVQKVWVVSQGEAKQQTVRAGRRDEHRVELVAGIRDGDLIVTNATEGRPGPVVVNNPTADTNLHAQVSDEASGAALVE